MALASLPVAANASVVHPLTACGYNIYSYGGTFADEFISDDCGTTTEP